MHSLLRREINSFFENLLQCQVSVQSMLHIEILTLTYFAFSEFQISLSIDIKEVRTAALDLVLILLLNVSDLFLPLIFG